FRSCCARTGSVCGSLLPRPRRGTFVEGMVPMRLLVQPGRGTRRWERCAVVCLGLAALAMVGCGPHYLPASDATPPQGTLEVDSPAVTTTVGSSPATQYFPAAVGGNILFTADATDANGGVSKVWLQGDYTLSCTEATDEGVLVHVAESASGPFDEFDSPAVNPKPGDAVFVELAAYWQITVSEWVQDCVNKGWSFSALKGHITAYANNYYGGTAHTGVLSFTVA